MAGRIYKILRKYAKATGLSYEQVKSAWDKGSTEQHRKDLLEILDTLKRKEVVVHGNSKSV